MDQLRSATEVLDQELERAGTDGDGWAALLHRIRAAARAHRVVAETESQLLELRKRAAAEVDAVYEGAARRAEELVFEARSAADTLVQQGRAEAALTLRNQLAEAEREAALVLERSQEQATAWMAEAKQACLDMVNRAREEADRLLAAARDESADVLSSVRRDAAEVEWRSDHRPAEPADLATQAERPTSTPHRGGTAPGEPLIGSRGATTAFGSGAAPDGRAGETAHRKRSDRDQRAAPGGRRGRFRR